MLKLTKVNKKETLKECLSRNKSEVDQQIIDAYANNDLVIANKLLDCKHIINELIEICEERGRY